MKIKEKSFLLKVATFLSVLQASICHELIRAYELDKAMDCIAPKLASEDELGLFHSRYYLDYLKTNCSDDDSNDDAKSDTESNLSDVDDEQIEYGLGYDCPKIKNLWKFVQIVGGASIKAANQYIGRSKNCDKLVWRMASCTKVLSIEEFSIEKKCCSKSSFYEIY